MGLVMEKTCGQFEDPHSFALGSSPRSLNLTSEGAHFDSCLIFYHNYRFFLKKKTYYMMHQETRGTERWTCLRASV